MALAWTDNSDEENTYLVQRRQGAYPWTTLATLAQDAVAYTDTDLLAGTYDYRVLAHVATGVCCVSGCVDPDYSSLPSGRSLGS